MYSSLLCIAAPYKIILTSYKTKSKLPLITKVTQDVRTSWAIQKHNSKIGVCVEKVNDLNEWVLQSFANEVVSNPSLSTELKDLSAGISLK